MDSSEDEQNSEKTNDSKDDTGVTVQIHSPLACKHVGSDEEWDAERRVYHHHNGGKDEADNEDCGCHRVPVVKF
ncbi:hypothetical protein HX775_02910 [Serratia proteamaculans]|uniref:hypothetical protein n=1 Tax=Serratia proteamaculans TaxID=28151 RepID=UPI0015A07F21|nr:hypothetical protein [Serratia proteamaculans]NWA70868.1 hypothetical protein [Serratia proteamaculans]